MLKRRGNLGVLNKLKQVRQQKMQQINFFHLSYMYRN